MEEAERELFEASVRHATQNHTGADLDVALEELGWHDALASDPRDAIPVLFVLQGAANATSRALDHVLQRGLGLGLGSGVVLPALGRCGPPGEVIGGTVRVTGLANARLVDQETAVVIARAEDEFLAVSLPTDALTLRSVQGLDPALALMEVSGSIAVDAGRPVGTWSSAIALARLALAHELIGASRTALDLARGHSLERIQFGRPISEFQAVRHRLADVLVAIETAEAVVGAAWLDGTPETAAMAKALAGRGARTTIRHCQQVLAGIGFTTEHPFHLYVRRILVLDELFGSARSLTAALGHEVLATGTLPGLLPL